MVVALKMLAWQERRSTQLLDGNHPSLLVLWQHRNDIVFEEASKKNEKASNQPPIA
jgi:hypothetical protein